MRVAVITPVGKGHESALGACRASVGDQAIPDGVELFHVIVADGFVTFENETFPHKVARPGSVKEEHWILLPCGANNAGATPRAIGSTYAVGTLQADVIAFLDGDCLFQPNHLAIAIELARGGAEVIASQRLICHHATGEVMFHDQNESDGDTFADTNTIVLAGRAAKFGATFDWAAPYADHCAETGADRVFWERLRRSFDRTRVATGVPTVRYVSPWLAHYLPGHEPPPVAKVMGPGPDGKPVVRRVRPKQLWLQHPETGYWHKPIAVGCDSVQLDMEHPHDSDGLVVFGNRGWEAEDAVD